MPRRSASQDSVSGILKLASSRQHFFQLEQFPFITFYFIAVSIQNLFFRRFYIRSLSSQNILQLEFFQENGNLNGLKPFLLEPFPIRTFSNYIIFFRALSIRTTSYQILFLLKPFPIRIFSNYNIFSRAFSISHSKLKSFSNRTFSDQTLFQLELCQ